MDPIRQLAGLVAQVLKEENALPPQQRTPEQQRSWLEGFRDGVVITGVIFLAAAGAVILASVLGKREPDVPADWFDFG